MYERIERIKKRVVVDRFPICIERMRIALDILDRDKNEPTIIRRANVLDAYVSRMPIAIADDELIVGIGASKPMGIEIDPDFAVWPQDEIDSLKADGFMIDPKDEVELQELNKRCNPPNLINKRGQFFYSHDRMINMMKAGVPFPPWKDKKVGGGVGGGYAQSGMGLGPSLILCCVDYTKILHQGTNAMIAQIDEQLENLSFVEDMEAMKKQRFWEAGRTSLQAMNKLAARYSQLAAEMAEKEADPKRKAELEQISEICAWVPANPARTFREAIQAFWFQFLMLSPSTTLPGGRFDQYMYPYYKADLEAGRITREEATELLCLLRLKDMELNRTSGSNLRKKNSGMAKWHNFIIGGVDKDGNDASNDISYMMLDAALITKTPHHTITLRVHDKTPEPLMIKALEVVRAGLGMPAFIGDKSYINTFMTYGVPLEEARDYVLAGCLDGNLPGKSRVGPVPMVALPIMFDIFRHRGIDANTGTMSGIDCGDFTQFKTYEELKEAFFKEVDYFIRIVAESNNISIGITAEFVPDPLRSVLMDGGIESGKEMFDRTLLFENGAVINPIGMINAGDSLTAIRKLVFDDKKYTLKELYDALEANWEGYEEMRRDFLDAPKYGNDDDYADSTVVECYDHFYKECVKYPTILGGVNIPTGISITTHQPTGALTGATPDGRKAKEILADGCVSPMHGLDKNGVTAVFKSAMKINQDPAMADLFNIKFHPTALKTEDDLHKLSALIRAYMAGGGKQVQFNVVSKETLREAQAKPQENRELVVRIAGYSAYFLQLSKPMQEEVIARNEHSL